MNSSRRLLAVILLLGGTVATRAGPYAPAPGEDGSTAVRADDPAFVGWADAWQDYQVGAEVTENFQTPEGALGPATLPGGPADAGIVSLGRGGSIVLRFSRPLANGPGPDFAVFENALNNGFLELAFVEVSSNGTDFVRFPSDSLTPLPQGAFSSTMDPTDIDGLAGKYRLGYGTPFDLEDLPASAAIDPAAVRFVRLVDIIGDGATSDTTGDPIYDPHPTVGSAGFDLDAVGVLHQAPLPAPVALRAERANGGWQLAWEGVAWVDYRIEVSSDLVGWTEATRATGADGLNAAPLPLPEEGGTRFVRVRAIEQ